MWPRHDLAASASLGRTQADGGSRTLHASRVHRTVALTALLVLLSLGAAGALAASPKPPPGSPSPAPLVSPGPTPPATAPGSVDWQPVSGVLGNALPGFSVDTTAPIVWKGHFYAVETDAVAL